MRQRLAVLGIVAIVMGAWTASALAEVVLVRDGQPVATIVTAAEPSEQAAEAAEAFRAILKRITGAELPIQRGGEVSGPRVLIGRSQAITALGIDVPSGHTHEMNEEGYVVATAGGDLVLAGNEDWHYQGTTYAVYDALEQLGCRWYFPGEWGEVLPALDTATIADQHRVERPSFRFRNLWYSGWMPATNDDQAELREWYKRNRMASLSLSLPGDGSVTRLAPADDYFESHPHIYALGEDGERHKDMLCMSEEDTVAIAVKTVTDFFNANPDALSFGFAPPDGFPMCHCDRCTQAMPGFSGKGYGDPSLSDLWFQFANRVAEEVYPLFPDRWLLTNGYANRVRPPEGIGALSPNLGIQSAIIAACVMHPIGDPNCWQRIHYKQILDRWTETLDCVFIYDYDPGKALENLPHANLHNLKHDIPYFRDRGLWGFWTEGSNAWMVTHLNYYVRGRLMWDADEDVDAIVRDYCENFYGAAADPIEAYIWTLENAVGDSHIHETWGRIMQWRVILAPVEERLNALMAEAEAKAGTPETKRRVALFRIVHDHMNAFVAMERAAADGDFAQAADWGKRMLELRDAAAEYAPNLLPHSPDWVRTFRTSLEWFISGYQSLADRTGGSRGDLVAMLPRLWDFKTDPEDAGVLYQWYLPYEGGGWSPIDTTMYWEAQGYEDHKGWGYWGHAWYKAHFDVPESAAGKPLTLTIGAVYNDGVWIWVNGVLQHDIDAERHWRLGTIDVRAPIDVDVTGDLRPGETNTVAVLVRTGPPGRNPRSGIHRRSFLWSPSPEAAQPTVTPGDASADF